MLYICATPIGNLSDITLRALEILNKSDIILCEDTRNSRHLLNHHGVKYKQLLALHEHNENSMAEKALEWLQSGLTVAFISDAGTPGVSDPGGRLCNKVLDAGLKLSPIPGASAFVSLLSVAGIDVPLLFHGFLPSQRSQRLKALEKWQNVGYAVSIYESPHRIIDCMIDVVTTLGEDRRVVMGRELTKQFETIKKSSVGEMLEFIKNDFNQQKGEFVLIIEPRVINSLVDDGLTDEQISTLKILLPELPPKKAVQLTNKISGGNKDLLYDYALKIKS